MKFLLSFFILNKESDSAICSVAFKKCVPLKRQRIFEQNNFSMKRFLLLLFFLVTSSVALAQTPLRDVLYLKSGSIIRGFIIEQTPPTQLKIQTTEGNIFVFRYDEILKIEREKISESVVIPKAPPPVIQDYGGRLGVGINLFGGGFAGIPVRVNVFRQLAFETSFNIFPDIYTPLVYYTIPGYNGGPSYTVRDDKQKTIYKTSPAFISGIDWFGKAGFNEEKNKIVKNGLLLRGGINLAEARTGKFFVLGWAHETFRPKHKKYSYLYEMGFGIMNSSPQYHLLQPMEMDWETAPFLYLKIHWNWYLL